MTLVLASACFSALGLALAMALPTMQLTLAVSNGIVIPLAFISDMFMMSGQMPDWLATIGWLFPLKHLTALFADALNPYLIGIRVRARPPRRHRALGAGRRRRGDRRSCAGTATATPPAAPTSGPAGPRARRRLADASPRRTGTPSLGALVTEQVRHAQSVLWRNASAVFFAVAFPVLLVAIIPAVNGGGDQLMENGQTLGVFYAGTMAIYGAAVTAYVNMPQGVAEARDRGVLKRTGGTPLPAGALLVGPRRRRARRRPPHRRGHRRRSPRLAFRPVRPPGLPAAAVVLVVAAVCFAVVGLAVMTFVHSAQALTGVTLGTLLPLAFISDIFVVGAHLPARAGGGVVVLPAAARVGRDDRGAGPGARRLRPGPRAPGRAPGLDPGRGAGAGVALRVGVHRTRRPGRADPRP